MRKNFYPVGKIGAPMYIGDENDRLICEMTEGQACYDVSGLDLDVIDLLDGKLVVNEEKKSSKESRRKEIFAVSDALVEKRSKARAQMSSLKDEGRDFSTEEVQEILKFLLSEIGVSRRHTDIAQYKSGLWSKFKGLFGGG